MQPVSLAMQKFQISVGVDKAAPRILRIEQILLEKRYENSFTRIKIVNLKEKFCSYNFIEFEV